MSTGAGTPYFFSMRANSDGVLLDLGEPVGDARAADHAVGELQEGLVEYRLAVVAADDRLIEGHAGERPR